MQSWFFFLLSYGARKLKGLVGPQNVCFGDLRYVHPDSWQRVNVMKDKETFLFHNELQDKIRQMFHRL